MQQILNVITPSATYDLVTLAEMKMKLMIDPSNTQWDALLEELITNISDIIAKICIRVFAYESVHETFYQLEDEYGSAPATRRLYLSRWPVVQNDITVITQDGVDISGWFTTGACILESATGTLYLPPRYNSPSGPAGNPAWCGQIDVFYSGGYQLPDGAPGAVKFAVEGLLRESYASWIRNPAMYGLRQVSHKESRVSYYGPNMFPVLGQPETWKAVQQLLQRFIRQWV
jgi:hypothetical protein